MTSASQLLAQLTALGVVVTVRGDRLRLAHANRVSPEMLEELKANKVAILEALSLSHIDTVALVDDLDACLRLGQRLKARAIPYVVCGITGNRCTGCGGIPCRGSGAP